MTRMEDDQSGRQPKWKTTKMEDNPNKSLTNLELFVPPVQPQLVYYFMLHYTYKHLIVGQCWYL